MYVSYTFIYWDVYTAKGLSKTQYTHMWIADATSALPIHILECNPATADTRRQIFIRANYKIESLDIAKERLRLMKKISVSGIFCFPYIYCT